MKNRTKVMLVVFISILAFLHVQGTAAEAVCKAKGINKDRCEMVWL